jgi:hypothetical protein
MQKTAILFTLLFLLSALVSAQDGGSSNTGRIRGGFFLKLGPVFPSGSFKSGQISVDDSRFPPHLHTFVAAKTGAGVDMGYLIYLGPAFAGKHLRAGIDATFISFWFNPVDPEPGESSKNSKYWYYFVGQKFGPMITVNPIDRLMLDLSYKIGFYGGYQDDEWGLGFWQSEASMNIRYSIMMVGLQYGWGKMNFNDYNNNNPDQIAEITTFRLLIGLKF